MILVVDDHADTVAFVCRMLDREGYETGCARDGDEALAILATRTPRLVILDVQMPGRGGLEVLAIMNADERLRAVPVIVYSAGHEKAQHDRAMGLGARAYLVKGAVGAPDLLTLVARHASPLPPATAAP